MHCFLSSFLIKNSTRFRWIYWFLQPFVSTVVMAGSFTNYSLTCLSSSYVCNPLIQIQANSIRNPIIFNNMHPKFLGFLPTVCHLVVFHTVSYLTYVCTSVCIEMEVLLFIHIILFFICYVQINNLNFNEWHIIVVNSTKITSVCVQT
jgi:hypothetical protein